MVISKPQECPAPWRHGFCSFRRVRILVFEIARQRYGLPAGDVQELARAASIVQLPKAPAIVEGVINVRGTTLPVLDIRARFRRPAKPLEPADHFVMARAKQRTVAIRADRALDLIEIPDSRIDDAKRIVPGADYVAGVAKLPDGLVLIHDLATFLSDAESDQLAGALPEERST
ncbi:MAG: purine-binding chemotaxis protein CheW [Planctomycetes bacterium]|nr:purine-binding chemotaxis protein CheW [Planctomycetota bacterium]